MKSFSKGSFTRFSQTMAPGGGGVLLDFTRRGTNYLHTTLLETYPKSNSSDSKRMFFGSSAPIIGRALTNTFSKGSFTRLFQKMDPGGGAFYQISPDVALTTCMQLLREMTPAICQYQQHSWLKLQNNSEVCMIQSPVQCLGCRKCEENSVAQMLLPYPRIRQIDSNALMTSAPSVNQKYVTGLQKRFQCKIKAGNQSKSECQQCHRIRHLLNRKNCKHKCRVLGTSKMKRNSLSIRPVHRKANRLHVAQWRT